MLVYMYFCIGFTKVHARKKQEEKNIWKEMFFIIIGFNYLLKA